ncbi:relaxase domain-containing protein [Escherichia coli]|nr:relaxase domain-containing protein [Escherichia coli]
MWLSIAIRGLLAMGENRNRRVWFFCDELEALASTRVMTDGQSETVLTGNLVMALFNHDTSRDQEPQLHTHAVVANVTQHNGEWKTLSSDKVGKTGFIENVYANQIAFGRLYWTMQTAFCIWTRRGCFWPGVEPFRFLPWCGG